MSNEQPRWTELEHLPEWDEEFYSVYTAKKHGKWVMLKTLKPELRDNPACQEMIEKEFDVRYNLAHPHIIMINDFEEVPGLGRCIITDDVYGDSLRKIIDKHQVDEHIRKEIVTSLVDAISYIQTNHIVHHPIKPETIIFTENVRNLKVIDVGFDQRKNLSPAAAADDIYSFGQVLSAVLDAMGDNSSHLRRVADKCLNPDPKKRYRDIPDLRMALEGNTTTRLYVVIISFLLLMTIILAWLVVVKPSF